MADAGRLASPQPSNEENIADLLEGPLSCTYLGSYVHSCYSTALVKDE